MSVYARSDVMNVTVSRAHGGCGQPHSRPVRNGAAARTWALDCPLCQQYLSGDPLWSGTLADVPATPDEDLARDSAEKQTSRSREDIMALALAKIAGLPVAEFLGGMIGQAADTGTVACHAGHENFPSAKFCAECGERISASGDVEAAHTSSISTSTTAATGAAHVEWLVDSNMRGDMTNAPSQRPAAAHPAPDSDAPSAAPPRSARRVTQPKRPAAKRPALPA